MNSIEAHDLRGLIAAMSARVTAERDRLNRLDAALGDGDHGSSISRAFQAAVDEIAALDQPSLSAIWLTTARTLMNSMGGASGAIFGTFFLKGAPLLRAVDCLDKPAMEALLRGGLAGVMARGKATVGDKTMVDALAPAVDAFAAADDYATAWRNAAEAASRGAESTINLVARQGRAKFLGERALGTQDPGATTIALIFAAADNWWKETCE